ncbi:MAG: hypothetical protein ABW221_27280 [Vicinamibacteria bacterium]
MRHTGPARPPLAVGAGLQLVESTRPPEDARELLDAGPRPCAALPDGVPGTTVALRGGDGRLLAVGTVVAAAASPLAESLSAASLRRSAWLADVTWRAGAERVAPLVLYAAARRARIDGHTTLTAHVSDPGRTVTGPLHLVPLPAGDRREGGRLLTAVAQRVDLAAHGAFQAWPDGADPLPEPALFVTEVAETVERWILDLYGRGFFRAVFEGSLVREQLVYALSNMHQFVRWTTRLLGLAVGSSHPRRLRDHFLAHLSGEINHELIIERDLAHLGADVGYVVDGMAPTPGTRHFMAVQESLIGMHRDPETFMASPLAAEGVASHLTPDFLHALESVVASWGVPEPRKAITFFTSHVQTDGGDDGHWETTLALVGEHLRSEAHQARFLGALRASMAALTRAYDEYVDDLAVFCRP